ncbi:MAG: phosphotransferase [Anaerolineae bacterium]|nr:phosphotransferase [Anaerolineae bacterium]
MDDLGPILQRIPRFAALPAEAIEIQELSGGITNRNYKIMVDEEAYVLRLGGNETQFLGINRQNEYQSSLLAAQIGIAPEPFTFLEPEGYILAKFIEGKGIPTEEIGTEENTSRVVASLKAYHALDIFPGFFSPFRVVETYADTARRFKVTLPKNIDWFLEKSREMEKALYGNTPLNPQPCHNDLLNGNFIDDGTRIRILDWEYAGMGDIFFDLGNFASQHDFSPVQDEILLRAYFGTPSIDHRARLQLMKIMSDLREAMWGMVQVGVSKLDFDYIAYAQEYFARVEEKITQGGYPDWLATLSDNP